MPTVKAVVALGSNLEDPEAQVRRAFAELAALPGTWVTGRSSLYRTAPVGFADQPPFVNACALLETRLPARELLDALLAIFIPSIFDKGSPRIARLFPNYYEVEQDYYRRTGIFPIMHTVVLREDIYREHPWAARSIYRAFCEARDLAIDGLYDTDALRLSLPWLIHHIEETWRVMGKDFWAYGLEPNRPTLKAIGEYVYEQGLSPRIVSPDELFAADVE